MKKLFDLFDRLDTRSFNKLNLLRGTYRIDVFNLTFLRIQKSPGAHPASIGEISCMFDPYLFSTYRQTGSEVKIAISDFLIRRFHHAIKRFAKQNRGAQGSGSFHTIELSPQILERDSVIFSDKGLKLRFIVSFPSTSGGGGKFDASQAKIMFQQELLSIARYCLLYSEFDQKSRRDLDTHIQVLIDRKHIQSYLSENHCIVFVPDNAVLPRKSGIDDRPLEGDRVKRFYSPDSLAVEIALGKNRKIRGMVLKEGVNVITGGGFQGKSTLLQSISSGIYPHIPGDGRERIVTRTDAVCVQSEEGRNIQNVNISPFIRDLPFGESTRTFSTQNASGSTSQAAGIIEALEAGSRFLIFDEDTSATNLLARDDLIEKIIPAEQEPIQTLCSMVQSMWEKQGISSLFVIGGLGIFLQKADTVLAMDNFEPKDLTRLVKEKIGSAESKEITGFKLPAPRMLSRNNFDPAYTNHRLKKKIPCRIKPLRNDAQKLEYGMDLIDLSAVSQLIESPQTLGIGLLIFELKKLLNNESPTVNTLCGLIDALYLNINQKGFINIDHEFPGTVSLPRKYELAAAVNRMRSLTIQSVQS